MPTTRDGPPADGALMELAEAFARRRMVRRFRPDQPVDPDTLDQLLHRAVRTPSAGFTQAVSLLVLTDDADRERYWSLTAERETRWLDGMRTAPVLVLVWTDDTAYLDRYAEPDKGWIDRDPGRWAAPYWWVDAGMSALALLVGATDAGLGACFAGVPRDRQPDVRAAYGVPNSQLSVGLVALGVPAEEAVTGSPTRRSRRPDHEVVHRGHWS